MCSPSFVFQIYMMSLSLSRLLIKLIGGDTRRPCWINPTGSQQTVPCNFWRVFYIFLSLKFFVTKDSCACVCLLPRESQVAVNCAMARLLYCYCFGGSHIMKYAYKLICIYLWPSCVIAITNDEQCSKRLEIQFFDDSCSNSSVAHTYNSWQIFRLDSRSRPTVHTEKTQMMIMVININHNLDLCHNYV